MWSRILETPIGRLAEANYTSDLRRSYHNWTHILRGYEHAEALGFEYDVNLDLAWLGHDWVYDEHPEKELRSIEDLQEVYSQYGPIEGVDMDKVAALIETSISHASTDDDRLIMMDLADLTDKTATALNFEKLQREANSLYGSEPHEFAQATSAFMSKMRYTIMENIRKSDGTFWSLVLRGVDQTIRMSEDLLERTK